MMIAAPPARGDLAERQRAMRLDRPRGRRSPGSALACQRLTWFGGIGVIEDAAAEPNIMTVPHPPAAFAAWYAISRSLGAPSTAMFVPWLVETMRFGASA
jgi:hypothetical protein